VRRRIRDQFLIHYLIVFLLTLLTTALAFSLLSYASGIIEGTLAKNRYPASALLNVDYTKIDASEIVEHGGGVQVVDADYAVVFSEGLNTFEKTQLNTEEFTKFLVNSENKPYHYDIVYQPQGEFWLIVTFPTSLRLDIALTHNPNAVADDFRLVTGVLVTVALVYLLILALLTYVYSRFTAYGITKPLRKLNEGTHLLREGDYSVRVDLHLNNEFAELQDTFNAMAAKIEHEMTLRGQAENDRRRLILDISHDLKNPLQSIRGYAELCLQNPEVLSQKQSEYLQVIQQNSQRANRLLTDLFELSQMDSPEFVLNLQRTDLSEFLRRFCAELIPQLECEGFTYEFDIPEESVYAMLDVKHFERIFQNLAENTLRYNKAGTKVKVSLSEGLHEAKVLFVDDGCGIPLELVEDIFKPFVRADESRNSAMGGSGLGLSVAKKIAQTHAGDLILERHVEKGCTFVLTIPTI
jgi:signal transduction histidine kinase